jgi:hypothetical protein
MVFVASHRRPSFPRGQKLSQAKEGPSSGASRHLLPQAGEVKHAVTLHFSRLREKMPEGQMRALLRAYAIALAFAGMTERVGGFLQANNGEFSP